MRKLPPRPEISEDILTRLQERTQEILSLPVGARPARARQIFDAARDAIWFAPIVAALRGLCGQGELCMYCSSNEPSQVEHFRPLAAFPERSMEYHNYLWSCDICNRTYKGSKFPPDTCPGALLLNPLDDNVWEHYLIDETFGRLIKRIDPTTNEPLPRAVSTCEVVGIDRENVQIKRNRRFKNLRRGAINAIAEFNNQALTVEGLRAELADWRSEPFQADVADYFLNGPGRMKEPFRTLLAAAGEPSQ